MPCPFCGAETIRITTATRTANADDGTSLKYRERLSRCAGCGEEFLTHEQSLAASRSRASVLRAHEGLLAPEQIRGIRERYGLSQADLERMLGLGAKTVVRWERGTVRQSQAADLLLRIVAEDRARAEKLAAGAGLSLAKARASRRRPPRTASVSRLRSAVNTVRWQALLERIRTAMDPAIRARFDAMSEEEMEMLASEAVRVTRAHQ